MNAHVFIDPEGRRTSFRYRILPLAGEHTLDEASLKDKSPTFLQNEIKERVKKGLVELKIVAQIGEEEDVTDDVTIQVSNLCLFLKPPIPNPKMYYKSKPSALPSDS